MPGPASTLSVAVLAATAALAVCTGRAPAAAPSGRVALEYAGILQVSEGPAAILVLREKGTKTVLPIILPDGRPFAGRSRGHSPEGLLADAIRALGGRVIEVEIEQAEETSSGARVRLVQAGKRLEVQTSPSESVSLALSAGVPIVTSRRVMDESGLTPQDLARVPGAGQGEEAIHL